MLGSLWGTVLTVYLSAQMIKRLCWGAFAKFRETGCDGVLIGRGASFVFQPSKKTVKTVPKNWRSPDHRAEAR
jgi:hypothetical protein